MSKYCTIVNFAATYRDGVYIDSKMSEPWEVAGNYYDLMQHATNDEAKMAIFDSIEQPYRGVVHRMCRAMGGMDMRARMNGDRISGPHIFHTDEPLSDEFLVEWAKQNLFNQKEK